MTEILRDDKGREYTVIGEHYEGGFSAWSTTVGVPGDVICRPVKQPQPTVEQLCLKVRGYFDIGLTGDGNAALDALIAAVRAEEREKGGERG